MRHGRNLLAVALMSNLISLVTGEAVQSSPAQPVEPGGTQTPPPVRHERLPDGLSPRQRRRLAKAARRAAKAEDPGA